eukprot:CAMPEP_0174954898 /NCGR_PEP_ID=MMETSP0004_2-20121128/683_1 /TAXON_ID=420556 /ORGANISM="Ochromonas sp., Strain CCMP1393" /LENGTH=404 /DNA_ID=CAMNT_0016202769 /DNA_START=87 /DNA_END=1300 /DNA_ORIENTATION=+
MFKTGAALAILVTLSHTLTFAIADEDAIAGYTPLNDVTEHAKIDLDMESTSDAAKSGNFSGAYRWYSQGGNSVKSDGSKRTIQGFSTSFTKLQGEKWYDIFAAYWNDDTYADTFTSSACLGTGDFAESTNPTISDTARAEGCVKGAQYQNVWYYVIHEMEAAIVDCNSGVVGKHWDGKGCLLKQHHNEKVNTSHRTNFMFSSDQTEAVAFYTGSIPGASGSPTGYLPFALAEKRCANFDTCDANSDDASAVYTALVNEKVFELFENGRDYQLHTSSANCASLESTKEALVQQFTIPLIQGALRYLYFADLQETEKTRAELWAFSAAVLPILDYYGASVATTLRNNALITNTDVVPDGYAEVKYQIETLYPDLGITCADVGGLASSSYSTGYYPGMEPCTDDSTS